MKILSPLIALASTTLFAQSSAQELQFRSESEIAHRKLEDTGGSIAAIVRSRVEFSVLESALELTGFDNLLDCYWFCWFRTHTLFAPTDQAFDRLPEGILEKLVTSPYRTHLSLTLAYHILLKEITAGDITSANSLTEHTLLGETVNVSFADPDVIINDNALVTEADIEADNGVIHSIDNVLLPEFMTKTIAGLASEVQLTSLVEAMRETSLLSPFTNTTATFTVFAPTNEAFQDLYDALGGKPDTETLGRVLSYHVVPGDILLTGELRPGTSVSTLLEDESIEFTRSRGFGKHHIMLNGDTGITSGNNLAVNGVVHLIDKVLLPSGMQSANNGDPDIVAIAGQYPRLFSSLSEALEQAGLVATLQGDGPFTVFAPTNQAFRLALQDLGYDSLEAVPIDVLTKILLYHVSPGKTFFRDLEDGSNLDTVQGSTISVTLRRFFWWIIGARLNENTQILGREIEAGNGVIHIISKVLIPPEDE